MSGFALGTDCFFLSSRGCLPAVATERSDIFHSRGSRTRIVSPLEWKMSGFALGSFVTLLLAMTIKKSSNA
jgi:hypothetical protein